MRALTNVFRVAGAGLAFAALATCGEATAPEVFNPVGTLGFSYSGALSGTFSASGTMEIPTLGAETVTGATGLVEDSVTTLLAFRAQTAGVGDAFTLGLGAVAPAGGTFNLDVLSCGQDNLTNCRIGIFLPGISAAEFQGEVDLDTFLARSYILASGSVTVTSRSELRIKGTFQGTALRGGEPSLQGILFISNGHFDLPIRKASATP